MKKHIFCFAFTLCIFTARGQSTWHTTYVPHLRHINSVGILNPDHIISAGGNEFNDSLQSIFFSGDQGFSWEINPLDDISAWIKSIDFTDSMHGIGVGYSGKMVKTYDGGHVWAQTVTPVSNTRHFNKVFFLDSLTGFVAGGWRAHDSIQTILKSTDGGNNWNIVYDQPGFWLRSIFFIDGLNGFAVGDSGTILKTTNGGSAWTPVTSPLPRNFNSLTFINATTGYIVGGDDADSLRTILQTTNGGQSWSVLLDEPGGWLTDIFFLAQTTGFIVGSYATFWKTANGGQSWNPEVVGGAQPTDYFNTVRFYNQNFGVIGAKSGKVYVYTTSVVPEITTFGATPRDSTGVTFSAILNTHNYHGDYGFVFSPDSNFSPRFATFTVPQKTSVPVFVQYNQSALTPHTTYYYYAVAKTLEGVAYGDTLSFTTEVPTYNFETLPAMNPTVSSVTLNGAVSKLPSTTNLYFEYDTTPILAQIIAANPAVVNDTLFHAVSAQLTSLIPHKTYYFRLKGTSPNGDYYGNILSFFSGNLYDSLLTLPATNVTDSMVTLNGVIDKMWLPATLSFEYGTTPSLLGNSIPASPGYINDTLHHHLTAILSGIQPFTVYYYRIKAQTATGIFWGTTMTFMNGNIFSDLQTLPATNVIRSSATLNGTIDKFQFPVTLQFEYGTNQSVGGMVPALPYSVNDTLQHSISATITNLLPYTTYYFRLKAQTSVGDFYGLTFSFLTGSPFLAFETNAATLVTSNSAQLNGTVEGITASTALGFDYGPTTAFGSYIGATPDTVSDTLRYEVSATLTGLVTDMTYYYRLHGTNVNGVQYYGDTVQVFVGTPEIPNWDFQFWNKDTIEQPVEWNIIRNSFARVAGRTGSALRLNGLNVALLGVIGEGIFGGQAFQFRPDSASCYLNYNVESGDSGFFGIFLFKGDSIITQNFFPILGNSGGQFQKLTFPLSYSSALMPDSLAVAFATSNIIDENKPFAEHPNNFMVIDDISFAPSSAPAVLNGNFEQWYDMRIEQPLGWYYPAIIYLDTAVSQPFISQVLVNAPDDFGVEVSNVNYKGAIMSLDFSNYQKIFSDGKHGTPVHARYQALNGYYRFFPQNGDTMELDVAMFSNGVIVGSGTLRETDSVPTFTPFEIPINYMAGSVIPDTVAIGLRPSTRNTNGLSRVAIDKLSFDGFVDVEEINVPTPKPADGITLFPNPTSASITIQLENGTYGMLQIFNLAGKLVYSSEFKGNKIEVATTDFSKGLYIVRILKEGKKLTDKFIVIGR